MLQWVETVNRVLDRYLMIITGAALVFATLLTFLGVILRYVFGISFEWNEEICRYSMIIIVYFWAGAMIRSKQHIYLSLFSDRLQGRGQDFHRFITGILAAALGIPIAIWGFQLTVGAYEAELRTMSLLFPLWPAYAVIPLGVTLIVFQAALDALRLGLILFSKSAKSSA